MKLRLTLLRCPPEQGADKSRELATGRLTIGRGPDNDWVLQDQERVLSKNHCLVEFKGGVYLVIDSSTNGVFLNDGGEPIGRGNTAMLHDGDRLRMGDFLIGARFVEDTAADDRTDPFLAVLKDSPAASPFAARPEDNDPFGPPGGPLGSRRATMEVMPIPEDDELFGARPAAPAAWGERAERWGGAGWTPSAAPDQLPVETEAIRIGGTAGGAIPDDWDIEPPAAPRSPAPSASVLPVATPAAPVLPDDWDDDEPLAPPAFALRPGPAAAPSVPVTSVPVTSVPVAPAPVPGPVIPDWAPDDAADPVLALARELAGTLLELARSSGRPLPPPFAAAADGADATDRLLALGPAAARDAVSSLAGALRGLR